MFKKLIVHLENPDNRKKKSLTFRIRSSDLSQKWALLVSQDLPRGIRENKRFIGFYKDIELEIHKTRQQITSLIDKLKEVYPEDFDSFDFSKGDNYEINKFHANFVDSRLSKGNLTKGVSSDLNDLNNNLHKLEWLLCQDKKLSPQPIPPASIYVTFYRKKLECLTCEDYKDSFIHQSLGTVYLNYSQVGRHIIDIFLGQDNHIPLDQIQLWNKFSSDFSIYLGLNRSKDSLHLLERIKKWYNKDMFPRLKMTWDPRKLCIGYIPVADMQDLCYSESEVKSYQKQISNFQKIDSVKII